MVEESAILRSAKIDSEESNQLVADQLNRLFVDLRSHSAYTEANEW